MIFIKDFFENEDKDYFDNRAFLIDFGESDFKIEGEAKTNAVHGTRVFLSPEKLKNFG